MKQLTLNVLIVLCCFVTTNAIASDITYINKTGTVYSAGPSNTKFTATTDDVTVTLYKTDGRAETQANIYVNGKFEKKMEFDNGNYTDDKTRKLAGVLGKEIKVVITNQSVGNTFKYKLVCTGTYDCPSVLKAYEGTVYSAGPKHFTLNPVCSDLELVMDKTGGRAETQVNIYVNGVFTKKMEFDNGNYTKTKTRLLTGVSGKTVKVDIINQSVGNTFKYEFTATQQ